MDAIYISTRNPTEAILVLFFDSDCRLNSVTRSHAPALASSKRRGARLYDEPLTINDQSYSCVTHQASEFVSSDICKTFLVLHCVAAAFGSELALSILFYRPCLDAGRISEPGVTVK
jgi:hypothetical protein